MATTTLLGDLSKSGNIITGAITKIYKNDFCSIQAKLVAVVDSTTFLRETPLPPHTLAVNLQSFVSINGAPVSIHGDITNQGSTMIATGFVTINQIQ